MRLANNECVVGNRHCCVCVALSEWRTEQNRGHLDPLERNGERVMSRHLLCDHVDWGCVVPPRRVLSVAAGVLHIWSIIEGQ